MASEMNEKSREPVRGPASREEDDAFGVFLALCTLSGCATTEMSESSKEGFMWLDEGFNLLPSRGADSDDQLATALASTPFGMEWECRVEVAIETAIEDTLQLSIEGNRPTRGGPSSTRRLRATGCRMALS